MKSERIPLVLFCILAVLAFAPMVQEHLHFPKIEPLTGVTEPVARPKFSMETYRDGSYQKKLEEYAQQNQGYRPWTIKLYNQYLWDFYKKTFNCKNVSFGKEGWLYEPWYVEDYYHGGTYKEEKDSLTLANEFDREALRIYQLQHILERHGITLFVCQAPGKDLIYPEYLPENENPERKKTLSARDYYEAKFETMGINHINMEQWFLQMKDTVSFLLFPQKGTHWSNLAATYAADSIFRYIETKQGIRMNQFHIGIPRVGKIRTPDNDLESLLNLMRPQKQLPLHYANYWVDTVPNAVKPKLITIGDSYYWNIRAYLPMEELFSSNPYWYYNSTIFADPKYQSTEEVNLVNELLNANAVMLIYSSTQLYKMSNDFCKNALKALCYDNWEIQEVKELLVERIKSDSQWMQSVTQRAEQNHIPVDTVLMHEADFVVNRQPELFLPALNDSIPVKESSQVRKHRMKDFREAIIKINSVSLPPK